MAIPSETSHSNSRPTSKGHCGEQSEPDERAKTSVPSSLLNAQPVSQRTLFCSSVKAPHIGRIEIIELCRSRASNAISTDLILELGQHVDALYEKALIHEVRAVIIASSLSNVFCAGADLKERKSMDRENVQRFLEHARRVFAKIEAFPVPTIASISGFALGGGLEIALCCHFRVISSNAVLGLPEVRLGIIPGIGGTFRLQRLVGRANAMDMILTGRHIESTEAVRMGLSSRLVIMDSEFPGDLERLRNKTLRATVVFASEISQGAPLAIQAALKAIAGESEQAERAAYDDLLSSRDRLQALEDFGQAQKRTFTGR